MSGSILGKIEPRRMLHDMEQQPLPEIISVPLINADVTHMEFYKLHALGLPLFGALRPVNKQRWLVHVLAPKPSSASFRPSWPRPRGVRRSRRGLLRRCPLLDLEIIALWQRVGGLADIKAIGEYYRQGARVAVASIPILD
jgi:hypothetical protein